MPMPLGPAMKQELPGVENFVRFRDGWGESFAKVNNEVQRLKVSFADPQIFSVFSFKFKYGNASSSLQQLNNIVLTDSKAKELFANEHDAIGKTIQVKIDNSFQPFIITGVAENIPANSSIQFDALANFNFLETTDEGKRSMNKWTRSSYITFVQLRPESNLPTDTKTLASFRHKYYPDEEDRYKKDGYTWNNKMPPVRFGLQTLRSMHTDTKIAGGSVDNIDPKTIWIVLAIAASVFANRLYQFYNTCYWPFCRKGKRNWHTQSDWQR